MLSDIELQTWLMVVNPKKAVTLHRKLEIIEYAEKNSGKKQNLIAEHFDIKSSTL